MSDKIKNVSRAHTRYRNSEGEIVPSVTAITGLLAKPALIKWANNLGLQGIDSSKYTDSAATIGTLIHEMVAGHITGEEVDLSKYSSMEMDIAEIGLMKYIDWEKGHIITPIFNEKAFVSDRLGYGGTLDFYCDLDGKKTLIDFKSGKGIYNEYFVQVSAYAHMLKEQGYMTDQIMILNIGRNEDEPFQVQVIKPAQIRKYFGIFKHLLAIYQAKKILNWV